MAKSFSYNREQLKREYMKSPILPITKRRNDIVYKKWKGTWSAYGRHIATSTKWRSTEKRLLLKAWNENAKQELMDEIKEEIKAKYRPSDEELGAMMLSVVNLMKYWLNWLTTKATKKEWFDPRELKHYWEMVKAERLEPTKINKLTAEWIDNNSATIIVVSDLWQLLDNFGKK